MSATTDTIFAPASGHGRAAICVIRLSGPGTRRILERMAGDVPSPRRLALRTLFDPTSGEGLDRALVAWMPGPQSFSGEDQAEFHLHGGVAIRTAVTRALMTFDQCRPAQAGEFTRRAFLNGRLDLTAVEGLADLIDAETEAQRRQALRQLEGSLGRLVDDWRERLLQISALLEASLDFSDEGDVAEGVDAQAGYLIDTLTRDIRRNVATGRRGERLRDGFVVVLAGAPNVGKSTLLNALARRDVAIVSDIPGTTRDAIEVRCDLGGLPVIFVDTAGVRETADPLEQAGIDRTRTRLESADLVVWLTSVGEVGETPPLASALRVETKIDLGGGTPHGRHDFRLSAKTGCGISQLLDRVAVEAESSLGQGDAVVTRERHRLALERALASLERAGTVLQTGGTELAAEDVRLTLRAIGEVTGQVDVDAVLNHLFASFCIGK